MIIKLIKHIRLLLWRCKAEQRQLKRKFKHAADFGISGNYSTLNAERFEKALFEHLIHNETVIIHGTYRGEAANHYYNRITKINVICKDNRFLSGWRLSNEQQRHILTTGNLT